MKKYLLALFAATALLASCGVTNPGRQHKQTIALFGGSFSVIPASNVATDFWAEQLNAEITKYGVGGAGFSNKTQQEGKHIQWQIDQACAPEAPVYDTYILWASTNDFNQANTLSGDPWDYTEYDGFDASKLQTQCGGINYCIKRIREKAPKARILFMTSTKCFSAPGSGTNINYQGPEGGMNVFVAKQMLCCQAAGVPFLDLFTLPPFSDSNFETFTESDHLHLNAKGYEAIRDLQVKFIREGRTISGRVFATNGHSDTDFGRYQRYAEANAAQKDAPVAVLYGDSITDAWPRDDPGFFTENNFVGRGISGQTTIENLARIRADVVDLHPKYVAILIGTNDLAENIGDISMENIVGNIASMVEIAQANGIIPLVCSVLPVAAYPWRPQLGPQASTVAALNEMIKRMAAEKNVKYVDYWSALNDGRGGIAKENSHDGVHPTLAGYKIMEKVLLDALK